MIKILLLFALGYFAWRALKGAANPDGQTRAGEGKSVSPSMDADLVRDPQCGVYVTRNEADSAEIEGRKFYFCSPRCKEKYISQRK